MINWKIIELFREFREHVLGVKPLLEANLIKRFSQTYRFEHGLLKNHQPLKRYLHNDLTKWMSTWTEPLYYHELINAKVVIKFLDSKGDLETVTDNFKFYTNSQLPSEDRLLRFKSFLILSTLTNRRISMGRIRQVTIEIEWYNYADDIGHLHSLVESDSKDSIL